MELPVALESALGAVLDTHVVASWKLTADNASDPVLVVRLKPVLENQHGSVNTHGYKRKTANQMKRDKERMAFSSLPDPRFDSLDEFKKRRKR